MQPQGQKIAKARQLGRKGSLLRILSERSHVCEHIQARTCCCQQKGPLQGLGRPRCLAAHSLPLRAENSSKNSKNTKALDAWTMLRVKSACDVLILVVVRPWQRLCCKENERPILSRQKWTSHLVHRGCDLSFS